MKLEEKEHMLKKLQVLAQQQGDWLKKKILSTAMVIKAYNVQLLKNLMYLWLHPPKHEKIHPFEKFHFVNTCHFHIGQWVSQKFIPKSKSCIDV